MDYENGLFDEWLAAIRQAESMAGNFRFVATGHGPVGTWEDIRAWREYLESLRDQVAAGIAAGQSLAQMQQTITMDAYSDYQGFRLGRRKRPGDVSLPHRLTDEVKGRFGGSAAMPFEFRKRLEVAPARAPGRAPAQGLIAIGRSRIGAVMETTLVAGRPVRRRHRRNAPRPGHGGRRRPECR